jgi:type IV pilus secretin PilQ/predicted competence protein
MQTVERTEVMIAHKVGQQRRRVAAALTAALAAGSILVSAAAAPVRLVGVSSQDNAILIESTEPVAYAVSRPDPLTLLVDLRNVSVADARADVVRGGALAGVKLEQAAAVDGASLARVRVALNEPSEYRVRSARNTIRVELTAAAAQTKSSAVTTINVQNPLAAQVESPGPATLIERVRARRTPSSTTITLMGNGQLVPSSVVESEDAPRRLVLDFPDVTPKGGSQVTVDSTLVKKVRLSVNSRQPLVTRVVMDLSEDATYHVERSGPAGRDLDIVFEPPTSASDRVMLAPPDAGAAEAPEPPITMEQAIRNAAAITADTAPPDPMTALDGARPVTPAVEPARPAAPAAKPAAISKTAAAASKAPVSRREPSPPPVVLAPPRAAPAPALQQTAGTEKKFTGHPVSLDFQGADLRAVLRGFSEISGLNMVIDPDVQGTVDIILNEVPWDQALDVILRGNQLDYTVDGTIVRIARVDTLRKEQDSRQALAKSAADAGTLAVRTFSLSYARASAAAPLIKKATLSARGDVQIDDRTNTLIVTDLPAKLEGVQALLSTIDRAEPQVEVEARIVQTTRDFARAVGIQWGLNGRVMPDVGNTTSLAFPNQGSVGGRLGSQGSTDPRASATEQTSTAVKLGVNDANSAIGLALGAVNGAFNLDIALSALERTGKGRVLSTPRLTTQNNIEAEVAQGIQIPIQTVANNTVTVSFKDAVLVLKVTPQITAANTVIMKITIENATPDFSRQVNGIPPIDTQRANTQVQINDGSTTVIGGIFVSQEQSSNDRTPVLNRVPLLGWLFKRDRVEDSSRELLIFITPRILKG